MKDEAPSVTDGTAVGAVKEGGTQVLMPAEQRVGKLCLADPRAFAKLPVSELADRAHVSKPTVVRFCRSVGYDGLADFKLKLAGSVNEGVPFVHRAVDEDDKPQDIIVKVVDNAVAALLHYRNDAASHAFERAIDALDPKEDAHAIVNLLANHVFPLDVFVATDCAEVDVGVAVVSADVVGDEFSVGREAGIEPVAAGELGDGERGAGDNVEFARESDEEAGAVLRYLERRETAQALAGAFAAGFFLGEIGRAHV